jgi:hypothetical protein
VMLPGDRFSSGMSNDLVWTVAIGSLPRVRGAERLETRHLAASWGRADRSNERRHKAVDRS